ncbi:MAG: hypothetical protein GY811_23270, partial [Myxococcales bacterium]|nr:hypothetical protein [Myxococcales bacterium]
MFEWIEALTVDRSAKTAEARASVSADERLFVDHFPTQAILPGSIVIELAAQVSGPLAESLAETDRYAFLAMVRNAKFLKPVYLPMQASIEARVTRHEEDSVTTRCTVLI